MSGWDEAFSNTHNRPYWFNKTTGESKWENPDKHATNSTKSIALMFLVDNDIYHINRFIEQKYFDECSVYIHPKRNVICRDCQQYVIKDTVQTSWADNSIVTATINLLRTAYQEPTNQWFVLLSYDAYPLFNMSDFASKLNKYQKSLFDVANDRTSKTSQFWIMNRKDVSTIISNSNRLSLQRKPASGAPDENYFLPLLRLVDPQYSFLNKRPMYVEWLPNVIARHPATFNKVMNIDTRLMDEAGSFFFRKTTKHLEVGIRTKDNYLIFYIGDHTNQDDILTFINTTQINLSTYSFIFVLMSTKLVFNPLLMEKSYKVYDIIWKDVNASITEITTKYGPRKGQLYFFTEEFHINEVSTLPMTSTVSKRINMYTYTLTMVGTHDAYGYSQARRGGKSTRYSKSKYKQRKVSRQAMRKHTRKKKRTPKGNKKLPRKTTKRNHDNHAYNLWRK
tara:strand:- start:3179 stop:4528 length:1350 start_codon:yes stop_codon:yes gene_type:complete